MSLKVMDGMRTYDGANYGLDIPPANYANANTMNGAAIDMIDFFELIAIACTGVVTGTAVATVKVQECDTAGGTYTNVTDAEAVFTANAESNMCKVIDVDWKHPDRKRYARVQNVVSVANAAIIGISTLRVQPKGGPMTADDSVAEA